jgi:hypothetical protein
MDVIWTTEKPKVSGLYWRRNSDQGVPYLTLVFEGPDGLKVRIVEQSINGGASGCENDPIERPVDVFSCGAWAGPLAPGVKPTHDRDSRKSDYASGVSAADKLRGMCRQQGGQHA